MQVQIQEMNDAKEVASSTYIVLLTSVVVLPVYWLVRTDTDASFMLVSLGYYQHIEASSLSRTLTSQRIGRAFNLATSMILIMVGTKIYKILYVPEYRTKGVHPASSDYNRRYLMFTSYCRPSRNSQDLGLAISTLVDWLLGSCIRQSGANSSAFTSHSERLESGMREESRQLEMHARVVNPAIVPDLKLKSGTTFRTAMSLSSTGEL